MANRHIGATRMNAESSRSHSVFMLNIQLKVFLIKIKLQKNYINGIAEIKSSRLHFVDLAGSER